MEGKTSFSVLEKEFMHVLRSGINGSEDKTDLEKHFSNTMKALLKRVFEQEHISCDVDDSDVMFDPRSKNHYAISSKLLQMKPFRGLWVGSDLPNVIGRFADSAHKKFLHMEKHREKARFKIR